MFWSGCGRKRSAAPVVDDGGSRGGSDNFLPLPNLAPDSRAELEELARHVLAQARLWEQLQHKVGTNTHEHFKALFQQETVTTVWNQNS